MPILESLSRLGFVALLIVALIIEVGRQRRIQSTDELIAQDLFFFLFVYHLDLHLLLLQRGTVLFTFLRCDTHAYSLQL